MRITTVCYVLSRGKMLMLHRIKKQQDENAGKWIGIGGHLEENESPEECIRREAKEETGLELSNLKLHGVITFIMPAWGNELTFLYTARSETEALSECSEGELKWIPENEVMSLPLWEGDRIFLPLMRTRKDCFSLKLIYDRNDILLKAVLDGKEAPVE